MLITVGTIACGVGSTYLITPANIAVQYPLKYGRCRCRGGCAGGYQRAVQWASRTRATIACGPGSTALITPATIACGVDSTALITPATIAFGVGSTALITICNVANGDGACGWCRCGGGDLHLHEECKREDKPGRARVHHFAAHLLPQRCKALRQALASTRNEKRSSVRDESEGRCDSVLECSYDKYNKAPVM